MHVLTTDDGVELHHNKDDAIESLLESHDVDVSKLKLTPDILVLYLNMERPWALLSSNKRAGILHDVVLEFIDIESHAREHVITELEYIYNVGPSETPSDIHPNESDTARVVVVSELDDIIDRSAFETDVVTAVEEGLRTAVDFNTRVLWDEATSLCDGNPARATTDELSTTINELYEDVQ